MRAQGAFRMPGGLSRTRAAFAYPSAPVRVKGVPATEIEDRLRFPRCGLMLDVAGHFVPEDDVLRHLDPLAAHKLNVFHFH